MEKPVKSYKSYLLYSLIVFCSLAIGYGLAIMISYTSIPACPNATTVAAATENLGRYMQDPVLNTTGVEALVIDMADYNAMTCILNAKLGNDAFRIYFGKTASGSLIRSIVGVMPNNSDNTVKMYQTSPVHPALCPPICDIAGPLSGNPTP